MSAAVPQNGASGNDFAPGSATVQHTTWAIWSLDARVGVAYRGRRGKERPNAWQIGGQAGEFCGAAAFWNNAGDANGKRTVDQDEQEVLVRQPPAVAQPDSATGASTKYQDLQIVYYYESIKREPKIRGIYECRCDERHTLGKDKNCCDSPEHESRRRGRGPLNLHFQPTAFSWGNFHKQISEMSKKKICEKMLKKL